MDHPPRLKQAWIIARIEMRRAFLSKRALWVYGLALFPSLIFLGHSVQVRFRRDSLSARGLTPPALMDGVSIGEPAETVLKRLGEPPRDFQWESRRRVPNKGEDPGVTTHRIEPAFEARFIRLNVLVPTHTGDRSARICELEVYGDGPVNLALHRPAAGSAACSAEEGPDKAFDGAVGGGKKDCWCSSARNRFLQVDLGDVQTIRRIVVKHAGAAGESEDLNTLLFNIQASRDSRVFTTIVNPTGTRFTDEIVSRRRMTYFDGRREARLEFADGKLVSRDIRPLLDFEEDRRIFAGVFQFFYLRLAIFFGCLGIFMNLFRGEFLDKTLHFWFLFPARREVLLAGKYGAGLIASTVIFVGGALVCFAVLLGTHAPAEVEAYWLSAGMAHAFLYAAASALACVGYGSVFLAAGLLLRNPIVPAAALLAWESINGFLPEILQKLSVLHYLQSLCPVPAPVDKDLPAILQLLLAPAAPASRAGAVLGLLAVTVFVLWLGCLAIRRMEVSYGTEA